MLSALVKAQLVAFLTKKLLDSPTFVGGVERLHGVFSTAQEEAYESLLKATQSDSKPLKEPHPQRRTADQPVRTQNRELMDFIERTKRDLEDAKKKGGCIAIAIAIHCVCIGFVASSQSSSPTTTMTWQSTLPSHSLFTLPPSTPTPSRPPSKQHRMLLVRGVDVVLAVGSQLRLASLADVKARCGVRENGDDASTCGTALEEELKLGGYKVLHTPVIDFEIVHLALNDTAKLLAVIGVHSVAIVVLPRNGWANTVGGSLSCRSVLVGKYYHHLPSSPSVSHVLWHPLGHASSSLLVLTSDATLREYSISEDVEEPAQTLSFSSRADTHRETHAGRGFSGEEQDAEMAVALGLGDGSGWGPLTVWVLMRNGDIKAVCPFLPRKAELSTSYIHSLASFVSSQSPLVDSDLSVDVTERPRLPLTPYHPTSSPSSFSTPSRSKRHSTPAPSSPYNTSTPTDTQQSFQRQFVASLVRQATTTLSLSLSPSPSPPLSDPLISITTPSFSRLRAPKVQGPFLLQPAPRELQNGADSIASDLLVLHYPGADAGADEKSEGVEVLLVAFSDGKIDVCLVAEKVGAEWSGVGDTAGQEERVLLVYESIDLGIDRLVREMEGGEVQGEVERALERNRPSLVRDPLYPDTVYVYHRYGAHVLMMGKWLDVVYRVMNPSMEEEERTAEEEEIKNAERLLRKSEGTDVHWLLKTCSGGSSADAGEAPEVVGMGIVKDVYLGYTLLLVTSSLQLAAIELSLRVSTLPPSSPLPALRQPPLLGLDSTSPAYLTVLDAPFVLPSPLSLSTSPAPPLPRSLLPPAATTGPLTITPSSLRFLGHSVESFRHKIRDLVLAADVVQSRLELACKETGRQVDKLAELRTLVKGGGGGDASVKEKETETETETERLERVVVRQKTLEKRLDTVLQRLMENWEPTVSSFERRWFDELARVEGLVKGEGGLVGRQERVSRQWGEVENALKTLKGRERGREANLGRETKAEMGERQLREVEIRLAEESRLIVGARNRIDRIVKSLARSSSSFSEA